MNRKDAGKDVVNAVSVTRQCSNCGKAGHIAHVCPLSKRQKKPERETPKGWTLAATEGPCEDDSWIVDSGASQHLVKDASVLCDAKDCAETELLTQPDGNALQVTQVGTVIFRGGNDDADSLITISNVYYAPTLTRNLLSLGQLVKRGCVLIEKHGSLVITNGGEPVFRVRLEHDVLVADLTAIRSTPQASVTLAMSASLARTVLNNVQYGSLMHFDERFGHLALDTVERIARDPHSGISITDHTCTKCVVCAEGKQSKRRQSKKDSGVNASIRRIGGMICSDLKGPLTPRDRLGNRYLVNFVDHRSKFCRVFAAKTKDEAARKFHDFLTFYKKRFSCKIHVLRTDGGGKYRTVGLFLQGRRGFPTGERGFKSSFEWEGRTDVSHYL
ncbi:hypothetical protein PF007_g8791 [Phytophthora fragariae]|uniref:CCHC-type domain-containing protein n=1 Tax=Phytophthora fragariae TaxID=53985 RepID=A0A6A3SKH8_9STRA|nr:hypothetical protein PF007_g8791 [Phytophthora fragariae]